MSIVDLPRLKFKFARSAKDVLSYQSGRIECEWAPNQSHYTLEHLKKMRCYILVSNYKNLGCMFMVAVDTCEGYPDGLRTHAGTLHL